MSFLAKCAPSRWADFLCIKDNTIPTKSGDECDLFVGQNKSVMLTLDNSTVTKLRDVVVLGKLIIKDSDPTKNAHKPLLIIRDLFTPEELLVSHVDVHARSYEKLANYDTFRRNLQELFLEWLNIQKESAAKIGLQSIFVR